MRGEPRTVACLPSWGGRATVAHPSDSISPKPESVLRTRRQPAQAIVELAIAMPVLLWFVLGTLDFGRVFYMYVELTNVAREGARRATSLAPACDLAAVQTTLQDEQPDLFPSSELALMSTVSLNCASADRRTVTITGYPFHLITPWLAQALGRPDSTLLLTTSATLPVVNQ